MADARLLEQRRISKKKKPDFLRQDATRNKSLEKKWRRPKGMHSKMRIHLRGRRKSPAPGYGSPRKVKGLLRNGLQAVVVRNAQDLTGFDAKEQCVVMGHIGLKKKIQLLKICEEKKYLVVNVKDVIGFLQRVEHELAAKKKKQKEKEDHKKKKEESTKKVEKKEEKKEENTEAQHETKKGEKSDKIKVLEKKQ